MVNDCSMEYGSCQTHLNFTRLCVLVNKCFFRLWWKSIVLNLHNSKKNSSLKVTNNFVKEKIFIKKVDYYYSNSIARASKTMSECRNEKANFESTGTEG